MKSYSAVLVGLGLGLMEASGALVAYWNMDAATVLGKLPADGGTQAGSVSAQVLEINGGIDPFITGTTVNLDGAAGSPNRGIGFYRTATVYNAVQFLMEDFNFTELSEVSVSFAYRSQDTFTWDSNLEVDYRIGNGSWVDVAELETWQIGYGLANVELGSAVAGQVDVDIRIRTVNWLSAYGYLDVDNIQINAVPEPRNAAFWFSASGALAVGLLRRNVNRRS